MAAYVVGEVDPASLAVYWASDGDPIDLTGYTFELEVLPVGGGSPLFTKSTGFTGQAPLDASVPPLPQPNLIVVWSGELVELPVGRYLMRYTATPSVGAPFDIFDDLYIRPATTARGYCEAPDLHTGGLTISAKTNVYDSINGAADEMDAKIGQVYQLPLDLSAAPKFVTALLRKTNAFLASGRLICAQALNSEDGKAHAYGAQLIKEAQGDIDAIFNGSMQLINVPKLPGNFKSNAPSIVNHDAFSALDAFEEFSQRYNGTVIWHPGPAITLADRLAGRA